MQPRAASLLYALHLNAILLTLRAGAPDTDSEEFVLQYKLANAEVMEYYMRNRGDDVLASLSQRFGASVTVQQRTLVENVVPGVLER
eukprot:SAG11_NODE_5200_length_1632_cov_1.299413_2_plen_87_part_00